MCQKIVPMILASTLFLVMLASIISIGNAVEWSPEMRLTWDYEIDANPSITQTTDGRIWLVWQSYRTGNNEIFYKVYNESLVHPWSLGTQLTNDTSNDFTPSIMQATDHTLWVVWTSGRTGNHDIYYKTFNGSWSSDEPLITDPKEDEYPSVMQTVNGTIWVVWASDRTGDFEIYYKTSSDNGETWSQERLTTNLGIEDSQPSVMQTADEKIWIAWVRNNDIFYTFHNGTSWSFETPVTTHSDSDWQPSIMQGLDERIWVVWASDRGPQFNIDIYYNIFDGSWSGDTRLTTDGSTDAGPSILQTNAGTIWISWSSGREYNLDIYYVSDSIPAQDDVAIFSVEPSSEIVTQGETTQIEVVPRNKGTVAQTFQVSYYVNSTLLGSETTSLDPGQLNQIDFLWNTSNFDIGTYVIWAEASIVAGETYIADNTYIDGTVIVVTHDVAIESVTPSKTIVHRGYGLYVYVEVRNEGNFTETVDVTAYYNTTAMGTQTFIGLAPNTGITLTFPWSAGTPYGYYTISAKAKPVPDENDLSDNFFTDGTVMVTIPGDVNFDRIVDILDAGKISAHWYPGPPAGPLGYDLNVDINDDGKIGIHDAGIISANWQKSW